MKKILLLMTGEVFREGGQHTRLKDTEFSFYEQKKACESHIKFFESLLSKYELDIHLETYKTKYIHDINKWYSGVNNYSSNFLDPIAHEDIVHWGHQRNLHYCVPESVLNNSMLATNYINKIDIDKYEGIFIFRPDLELKNYFIKIFNPEWEEIRYPNRLWLPWTNAPDWFPNVNDTMLYIPKKFFDVIRKSCCRLYHHGFMHYIQQCEVSKKDIDFMIQTLHDSDSGKDYNPLYRMVSRDEVKYWYSYGYEISPKDKFHFCATDKKYEFDDWNLLNNNISKIEKNNIKNIENIWEWWHAEPHILSKFHCVIELDTNPIFGQRVGLSRNADQSFWDKKNNDIIIFNDKEQITSILSMDSEISYSGSFVFDHNIHFKIKKYIR